MHTKIEIIEYIFVLYRTIRQYVNRRRRRNPYQVMRLTIFQIDLPKNRSRGTTARDATEIIYYYITAEFIFPAAWKMISIK